MHAIVNAINGDSFGTFKFQYSNHHPVNPNYRFIPQDKILAEKILGWHYFQFKKIHFKQDMQDFLHNNDDSHKKADVYFKENGGKKGMQITQLLFTQHEARRIAADNKNKEFVHAILKLIRPKRPVIINIMPQAAKSQIPLFDVKRGKSKIEAEIIDFIAESIKVHQATFDTENNPIWIPVEGERLNKHIRTIVLNPVPPGCFPRFYGRDNIYVNYDFDDVSFNDNDIDNAVSDIFIKKNNGKSEILLIWSDDHELAAQKRKVVEKLYLKFYSSSFKEVYFMTFYNHIEMFIKSLELWPIKPIENINFVNELRESH